MPVPKNCVMLGWCNPFFTTRSSRTKSEVKAGHSKEAFPIDASTRNIFAAACWLLSWVRNTFEIEPDPIRSHVRKSWLKVSTRKESSIKNSWSKLDDFEQQRGAQCWLAMQFQPDVSSTAKFSVASCGTTRCECFSESASVPLGNAIIPLSSNRRSLIACLENPPS
eukprot:648198-Rhodomonas_salina.1